MSSSILIELLNPMRTTKWSSTTNTRIFFLTSVVMTLGALRGGHLFRTQGFRACGKGGARLPGDLDEDFGPLAGGADHVEAPAHFHGAFAHVPQAEMAAVNDGTAVIGVEARPVVHDPKGYLAGGIME